MTQPSTVIGGGIVHSLTSEGHDASEDGTGRGTPIVAVSDLGQGQRIRSVDQPSETLWATKRGPFSDYYVQPLAIRGREGGAELEAGEPGAPYNALRAGDGDGGSSRQSLIAVNRHAKTIVRRLTPIECERLQGYDDNWTEGQADSARYRQLGNSVAVPCVEWIAQRLIAADEAGR